MWGNLLLLCALHQHTLLYLAILYSVKRLFSRQRNFTLVIGIIGVTAQQITDHLGSRVTEKLTNDGKFVSRTMSTKIPIFPCFVYFDLPAWVVARIRN